MRELSQWERGLLEKFGELLGDEAPNLADQVGRTSVHNDTGDWVDFTVDDSATRLGTYEAFPMHGWYRDTDGQVVFLTLHIGKSGLIDSLERYKHTPDEIRDLHPSLADVRVQKDVPTPCGFDFDRGWVSH